MGGMIDIGRPEMNQAEMERIDKKVGTKLWHLERMDSGLLAAVSDGTILLLSTTDKILTQDR